MIRLLMIFTVLLQFSAAVNARSCDDEFPFFYVNGELVWEGTPAEEIFEQADKKPIAKAKKVNATGILLGDLVKPYANEGTLVIKSCGKKSVSFKVEDLLSKDIKKSSYYLAKTKKNTFKLMFADGVKKPGAVLKRIQTIEIISRPSSGSANKK